MNDMRYVQEIKIKVGKKISIIRCVQNIKIKGEKGR